MKQYRGIHSALKPKEDTKTKTKAKSKKGGKK